MSKISAIISCRCRHAIFLFLAFFIASGCNQAKKSNTSTATTNNPAATTTESSTETSTQSDVTPTNTPGILSVAEQMVSDLGTALKDQGSLGPTQVDTITAGALALAVGDGASLRLASSGDTANDVRYAAPAITEGAVSVLSDVGAGLTDDTKKAEILEIILSSVGESSGKFIEGLSDEDKAALPGNTVKSGVEALPKAGFSKDKLASAASKVFSGAIKGIKGMKFSEAAMKDPLSKVASLGVGALGIAGFNPCEMNSALKQIMEESLPQLNNAGVSQTGMPEALEYFAKNAATAVPSAGLKSATQIQLAVSDMMEGAVKGLKGLGISGTTDLKSATDNLMKGVFAGVGGTNLQPAQMIRVFDGVMEKTVAGIKDFGITDPAQVQDMMGFVTKQALSHLDGAGSSFKNESTMKEAAAAIGKGAMAGVQLFKQAGIVNDSQLKTLTAHVTKEATTTLYEKHTALGFSDFGSMATQFTTGVIEGFVTGGLEGSGLTTLKDNIKNGFQEAMTAKNAPNAANLVDYVANATTGAMNERKTLCEKQPGAKWDDVNKRCIMSVWIPPPSNASINLAETTAESCESYGGCLAEKAEGEKYCNVSSGATEGTIDDETKCTGAGFAWIKGSSGGYCETAKAVADVATSCEAQDSNFGCLSKQDCMWNGDYCVNTVSNLCAANFMVDMCRHAPGCYWDFEGKFCKNGGYLECAIASDQSACNAQVGCLWDGTVCQTAMKMGCQENQIQADCYKTPGCIWMQNRCVNGAVMNCPMNQSATSCSQQPGCMWDGFYCTNMATLDCYSIGANETACRENTGCNWEGIKCQNIAMGTSCTSLNTQANCLEKSGCFWDSTGSFCANSAFLDCGSNTSSGSCLTKPGCMWDSTVNNCKNGNLVGCGAVKTSANCAAKSGCFWNGTFCVNNTSLDCGIKTQQPDCAKSAGCIWNFSGSFCMNANFVNCGMNSSETNCGRQPGCVWTGTSCNNTASLDCPNQKAEASCTSKPSCIWDLNNTPAILTDDFCRNAAYSGCGAKLDSNACSSLTGCLWDDSNGGTCINSGNTGCGSKANKSDCTATQSCFWDDLKSFCANSIYLDCGSSSASNTCLSRQGCMWDSAVNTCRNGNLIGCSSATSATCTSMPGCLWNGTSCVNNAAVICGGKAQNDCLNATGCYWDNTNSLCINANFVNCGAKTTSTTCQAQAGCSWTGTYCNNAASLDCPNQVTEATCSAKPGCIWDLNNTPNTLTDDLCRNSTYSSCAGKDSATCPTITGCIWNGTICINSTNAGCGSKTTQTDCTATTSCYWDNAGTANVATDDFCAASTFIDCASKTTSPTCAERTSCFWDEADDKCKNNSTVNCSSISDGNVCLNQQGCLWSNSLCVNASNLDCSAKADQKSCLSLGGCLWDFFSSPQKCFNSTNMSCSGYSLPTCNSRPGCAWDQVSSACKNSIKVNCGAIGNSSNCMNDPACTWNGNFCQATLQVCPARTSSGQELCAENTSPKKCLWDSGGSFCKALIALPCSAFTDAALCTNDRKCKWFNSSCVPWPPCSNFNSDQASCTSVASNPACVWYAAAGCLDKFDFCKQYDSNSSACTATHVEQIACSYNATNNRCYPNQ